jgi:hypothetical protein
MSASSSASPEISRLRGNFDGDGCDTLSIYRPAEGRVYISDTLGSNGGFFVADFNYYFGNPGDKPLRR